MLGLKYDFSHKKKGTRLNDEFLFKIISVFLRSDT